ncbi:unnamed protein product [Victoria cruziana]
MVMVAVNILGFLLSFCLFLSPTWAGRFHYEWNVTEANYTRLCSTKTIITINGLFPGPTLYARRGDVITVNVRNLAKYNITIHWHGLRQPRNPWSDGPEYITMCGIRPSYNFTYTLIFSEEEGTIWYHAHSDWSRATIHGAIVVYPPNGVLYPYPRPYKEYIVIISEWWTSDVMQVLEDGLVSGRGFAESDAYMINGQPGDLYSCSKQNTTRFHMEPGKSYMLRVINAAMAYGHYFAVANHNITLVGRDGAYVSNESVEYICISPGQGMDVLIAADQTPGLYYMAAKPYNANTALVFDNTTTTAIVEYTGYEGTNTTSATPFPTLPAFNDSQAVMNFVRRQRSMVDANHSIIVPTNVTRRLSFAFSINYLSCETCTNNPKIAASVNNVSFLTPSMDILQAYHRNISGIYTPDFPNFTKVFNFTSTNFTMAEEWATTGTKVVVLEYNETVELVMQGTNMNGQINHPLHLHGHSFFVMARDFGNFDPDNDPKRFNLVDPPYENTVGVPASGWVAVRFRAVNPGVWLMHCHLERHFSWGMIVVFITKNGPTKETSMLPPPPYMPPC